jgi:hypothetical protein
MATANTRNDPFDRAGPKANSHTVTWTRILPCHSNSPHHGSLPVKSNKYALTTLSIA